MVTIEILEPAHFEMVARWLSNREVNRWLTSEWRDRVVDSTMIGIAARNRKNRLFLVRCDGTPCGLTALADFDSVDRIAMIWYVLGEEEVAGRGVTTSAVRQVVDRGFRELQLKSIYAWIMEDNLRSRRVLEKVGFREAGCIRLGTCSAGRQVARVYFDIVRPDENA